MIKTIKAYMRLRRMKWELEQLRDFIKVYQNIAHADQRKADRIESAFSKGYLIGSANAFLHMYDTVDDRLLLILDKIGKIEEEIV